MPNYANGKLYKIVSDFTDKIYIGSTTQPLSKRHHENKSKYDGFTSNEKESYHYVSVFEIMKIGSTGIVLIEDFPCKSREHCMHESVITSNKINRYVLIGLYLLEQMQSTDIFLENK